MAPQSNFCTFCLFFSKGKFYIIFRILDIVPCQSALHHFIVGVSRADIDFPHASSVFVPLYNVNLDLFAIDEV